LYIKPGAGILKIQLTGPGC